MQQKTVSWDDATLEELKSFAAGVLGMQVNYNVGEETLRGKIRQAYPGDSITIMVLDGEDDAPAGDAPVPQPETPTDGKALRGASASGDPKVKITIAEVEGPGGKRAVPVGVNGVIMLIPRGRPVDVPFRYYEDLLHAVKTTHEQDEATGEIISSDVPSYPMSVNTMPPKVEVEAYFAAQGAMDCDLTEFGYT